MLESLSVFAGWDLSFSENLVLAGVVLLVPASILIFLIGALTKKNKVKITGLILLAASVINYFVFFPIVF